MRYSIGDDRVAQRLTPRRKRSAWSAVNIRRFGELERLGLVHPRGRAAFDARDEARSQRYSYENRAAGLDAAREAEFHRHMTAWKFFESQAPWYQRTASHWVMSAKREETRDRRLKVLIAHSKDGERIPPLSRSSRPSPRSP